MFLRLFILTCVISCVVTQLDITGVFILEHKFNPDARSIDAVNPFNELPCMVINGTCRAPGKCPQGTRVTTEGLCPYQETLGIQCCHTSTAKLAPQRTCLLKGGECMEPGMRCPEMLTIKETDCARNSVCCVLIH